MIPTVDAPPDTRPSKAQDTCAPLHPLRRLLWIALAGVLLLPAGCAPTQAGNVAGYMIQEWTGVAGQPLRTDAPTGEISGRVLQNGRPLANASVLVAERWGTPHATVTDAEGAYRITGVPPGSYVPAAVAPGFEEGAATDALGVPWLVTVQPGRVSTAPDLTLARHRTRPLPTPLAAEIQLTRTGTFTATAPFPPGSAARVDSYSFVRDGVVVDTLRTYLPLDAAPDEPLPLLFFAYPGVVDGWQSVSVAYAAQGFGLAAISPVAAWGVDIEEHTYDARIALALAQTGELAPQMAGAGPSVALGGSFTSAILHRLLRDTGDSVAAWVTVGGIANAFTGAADFYAGRLELPPAYRFLIPAMGRPDLYPLPFLRYSPVYTAAQLPPTMIVHTAADTIIPIEQAFELEAAARAAGVPVETFYYEDVSHYLQIDENLTPVGEEMFYRILDFIRRYGTSPAVGVE